MTPSELKAAVESAGHESHFFTRDTMRFHGDTMKNYGVRKVQVTVEYDENGEFLGGETKKIDAWELYRKRAVKHGVRSSAYFHPVTFRRIFPKE